MINIDVCPACVQMYNPSSIEQSRKLQFEISGKRENVLACHILGWTFTFLDPVDGVVVWIGPRHRGQFPEQCVRTRDGRHPFDHQRSSLRSQIGEKQTPVWWWPWITHLLVRQPVLPHVHHVLPVHRHRPVELCVFFYKEKASVYFLSFFLAQRDANLRSICRC